MFGNVINIRVENAGASSGAWTAFGFNAGTTTPSQGASITVNSSPNSMGFAARESQQQPYVTKKIKIKVSDVNEFNNSVTITGQVMGEVKTVTIEPLDYADPNRGIAQLIEIPLPEFVIDGSISISGTIGASASMNIIIDYDYVKRPGYKSALSGDAGSAFVIQQAPVSDTTRNSVINKMIGNNRVCQV